MDFSQVQAPFTMNPTAADDDQPTQMDCTDETP
jgi:hypothetical protein